MPGNNLPTQPITAITCAGDPYEMGVAQGRALREKIHSAFETVANLEAVRLMKPWGLPFGWFLRFAEAKAAKFLKRAFTAVSVNAADRLRGIAAGADVPFRKLALCSALEAVLSDLRPTTVVATNHGCSAIAATGSATLDGDPILAHNFDYLPVTQPYYFIRRSEPANGLRSVELSVAPLAGAVTGVNEAGLSIICNYAYAVDTGPPAPTITMLIADALARFETVDQATDFLANSPRVGGGLLMLGDAGGAIASIEISNTRLERRDSQSGTDRLCHTNRYCKPAMREVELHSAATHHNKAPQPLRGRRVHRSSEDRDADLQTLVTEAERFDRDTVQSIMSHHGPVGEPSFGTVCMHSDYWFTTASLQLLPAERRLRVSFSPTCVAEYRDFVVGETDSQRINRHKPEVQASG